MKNFFSTLYPAVSGRVRAFAEKFAAQSTLRQYLWIALFLLAVILLNSQFISKSGDAIHKWMMTRLFAATGSFEPVLPDHHMLRWGLMFPAIGMVKLFGDNVFVYYLYPMLSYLAGGLVFFTLARQILTRAAAPAAVLLYAFYPEVISEGTQFLPMVPATVWILACLLCALRAAESEKHEVLWMAGAGLALSLAYGCKETSFYWAPGIFLFFAFAPAAGKKLLSFGKVHITAGMIVFSLVCVGALLLETLLLNRIYGCSLGRFELLSRPHFRGMSATSPMLWEYLFSPFRTLHWHGKYFSSIPKNLSMIFGIIGAVTIFLRFPSLRKRLLAAAFLGAFLCHSYVIFKINPICYPEKPHHRYFIAVIVVGLLLFAAVLPELRRIASAGRIWRSILLAGAAGTWLLTVGIYDLNARLYDGTLFQMERMRRTIPAAFADGTAVGIVTDRDDLSEDAGATRLTAPDKWGKLYLQAFGSLQQAVEAGSVRCAFTPFQRGKCIVWLTPQRKDAGELVIDEFRIIRTGTAEE